MIGFVTLALAYVLSQFYRSFLAVLTPQLSTELGMTSGQLSDAAGVWYIAFGLMQFAVGVCLDRYGPRRTTSWILLLFGAGGAVVFAFAQTPTQIILAMGFIGIGCSPVLMASFFIFARSHDTAKFALFSSWLVAFGTLGNVIGTSPMALVSEALGWRGVMLGFAGITMIVSVSIGYFVRDPEKIESGSNGFGFDGYLTLLRMPVFWAILPLAFLISAPTANIRGLWLGPYLSDLYDANSALIGTTSLWMALAMVAGSFIYGPLDRIFDSRKKVVLTGNAGLLITLLFLSLNPTPALWVATLAFVALGLTGTSFGVVMAHGRSFVPSELTGRGVTLLNFAAIFGTGTLQYLSGRIVEFSSVVDARVTEYRALFSTYAAFVAFALLIYLFSRDSKPSDEKRR